MTDPHRGRPAAQLNVRLLGFAAASFAIGAALMLFFESTLSRIVGLAGLFAFIVAGLFLVAAPSFLEGDHQFPPEPRE
jgi:hypothetical protein